jgi:hypothetical protein
MSFADSGAVGRPRRSVPALVASQFMPMRNIKIKTGWIPIGNPWLRGFVLLGVLVFICFVFLGVAARVAGGVFGEPLHPIGFWVAACFTGFLFVWGFYWLIGTLLRVRKQDSSK